MGSLYPKDRDSFRTFVDGDDMVAADLNDIFDSLLAIETELGINPSGEWSTISSRVFGNENLSGINGLWKRIEFGVLTGVDSQPFGEEEFGYSVDWTKDRFLDSDTEFGSDVPGMFFAAQGPNTFPYAGLPWSIGVHYADIPFEGSSVGSVYLHGRDGNDNKITSSNKVTNAEIGYLFWGMFT